MSTGRVGQRQAQDHHVGTGQQRRQLVDTVHRTGRVGASPGRHPDELDLEARQTTLDGRADRAVADEQDATVGQ
jgi:hypothetical protein